MFSGFSSIREYVQNLKTVLFLMLVFVNSCFWCFDFLKVLGFGTIKDALCVVCSATMPKPSREKLREPCDFVLKKKGEQSEHTLYKEDVIAKSVLIAQCPKPLAGPRAEWECVGASALDIHCSPALKAARRGSRTWELRTRSKEKREEVESLWVAC